MSRIVISNLAKSWGDVDVINNISFEVPNGSLTVLLGPSGCGKSTVLRMIAGLETASAGSISIGGKEVLQLEPSERGVSMVFQSYALFPHLSVKENIMFGLKVRRVPARERISRMNEAAKIVGLDQLLHRKPAQLSGGQRQRIALARAIVSEQPVCLMDEPLSNLDAKLRAEMRGEIVALQRRLGLTMVYVTHDQVEAMSMADQIVLLNGGDIEQKGPPAELYEQPGSIFVSGFIGMPPMNVVDIGVLESEQLKAMLGLTAEQETSVKAFGIRPESIQVANQGLAVRVLSIDYLGGESIIKVKAGEQPMVVKVSGNCSFDVEQKLNISWSADDVVLFDGKGRRVVRASQTNTGPEESGQ